MPINYKNHSLTIYLEHLLEGFVLISLMCRIFVNCIQLLAREGAGGCGCARDVAVVA